VFGIKQFGQLRPEVQLQLPGDRLSHVVAELALPQKLISANTCWTAYSVQLDLRADHPAARNRRTSCSGVWFPATVPWTLSSNSFSFGSRRGPGVPPDVISMILSINGASAGPTDNLNR
jgi:hypothetical protein